MKSYIAPGISKYARRAIRLMQQIKLDREKQNYYCGKPDTKKMPATLKSSLSKLYKLEIDNAYIEIKRMHGIISHAMRKIKEMKD